MSTTQTCPRCQRDLGVAEFGFRDRQHTRRQSYCRACQNHAWREWYAEPANKERHLALVAARRRRRIQRNRALVSAAKDRPCEDCGGEFDTEVMDLDHITGEKLGEVSSMIYTAATSAVRREIAKCEVVCANCHRRRTRRRAGS